MTNVLELMKALVLRLPDPDGHLESLVTAETQNPTSRTTWQTFTNPGAVTVGTGSGAFPLPVNATVTGVIAYAGTGPTGASLIMDVNKNGATIFTMQANRPSIPAGGRQTVAAAVPDIATFAAGDVLSVDVDQVGSTVAGSDVTVVVLFG